MVARILSGGNFVQSFDAFEAQALNQRFYYETMSGSSPGVSRHSNSLYSTDRKSSGGFGRHPDAYQRRWRFHCAIAAVRLMGNRPHLRSRLAAAAGRYRLAALHFRLMGVDGRRLVLAKR